MDATRSSSYGAAAAYLVRRIASRAGAYAPGIQEHLFWELSQSSYGYSLGQVETWLMRMSSSLGRLGYNILTRFEPTPTREISTWVQEGFGYRGALLAVHGATLHNDANVATSHAVALLMSDHTSGIADPALQDGLVVADPWPSVARYYRPTKQLEAAHRLCKYGVLKLFWNGYS